MNATTVFGKVKGTGMENSKWRGWFDFATLMAIIGLAFNAGIEYNKIDVLTINQASIHKDIQSVRDNEEPLNERVARMEAILQDIRDELRQSNEAQRK